jgi:cell division protein FtsI/penicillin-binding protein 2
VFNTLGAPTGLVTAWNIGDVVIEVKTGGVLATASHRRYDPRG